MAYGECWATMQTLTDLITAADSFIWRPYLMPAILVIAGVWLTLITGAVQWRGFPRVLKSVAAGFRPRKNHEQGTITSFQALATALASTVGNGNIGGVATAILVGGPGAIFWMWVFATFGMATKFAEATLGVHFRVHLDKGLASGPMYYIIEGIGKNIFTRLLAGAFAFFGLCAALFGTGNMIQANTIARTVATAGEQSLGIHIPHVVTGAITAALVGMVLLGGIQRIASVAEKLVPTMILIYLIAGLSYIFMNLSHVPTVVSLVIQSAFSPVAAVGGFAGASLSAALASGVSRGVVSNEAGLGSAPIAHGIADVSHPVEQGLVGIFEVAIDTLLVCSITAFIILSSGLWTDAAYQHASGDLTAAALQTSIPGGPLIVAGCSLLFGFSTLVGWCYYGEKCFEFLFGSKFNKIYRAAFTVLVFSGAIAAVPLVWAIATLFNGLMALPNLIALLALSGVVRRLTRDYFAASKSS